MVRTPFIDSTGLKRGAWSPEEDNKLRAYIHRYGHWNWRQLPKFAGLSRCGKSCRLRWMNYLKPGVRRGNYTPQEEDLILDLYRQFGSKWSVIAAQFPGRVDNDIKNHWNSHLRRKMKVQEPDSVQGRVFENIDNEVSKYHTRQDDQLGSTHSNQVPSLSYDSTLLQQLEYDVNQDSPSTASMESVWDGCIDDYMQVPLAFEEEIMHPFTSYIDEINLEYSLNEWMW